jgi:hypothetical protein
VRVDFLDQELELNNSPSSGNSSSGLSVSYRSWFSNMKAEALRWQVWRVLVEQVGGRYEMGRGAGGWS